MPREGVTKRFGPLAREEGGKASAAALNGKDAEAVLKATLTLVLPNGGYCIGHTKVFFKGSELPTLEARRLALCAKRAVRIQAHARRRAAAAFFRAAKKAAPTIQAAARKRMAIRVARTRRLAATRIGKTARGLLARKRCFQLRRYRAAVRIQKVARGAKLKRRYITIRRAAVIIQKDVRMRSCRRVRASRRLPLSPPSLASPSRASSSEGRISSVVLPPLAVPSPPSPC